MKNRKLTKIVSAVMAAIITVQIPAVHCQAGAPAVSTDESVYVNMDYYGAVDHVSIVKGCTLNGNTKIEDYGNYEEVLNMSSLEEPKLEEGKVIWELPAGTDRFFYECKTDGLDTNIPWSIDVSYQLNGAPKKAEELAGASGMVTMQIDAVPNKKAPEYYKNNLILTVGTMVDMEKVISVEAPGSQLQSVGTKKLVFYVALPGEEGHYEINIGTESFETTGVMCLMIPGTMSSLDTITDLRETKNTFSDSLNAMNESADVILDTLLDMKEDLQMTKTGMTAAKKAKKTADQYDDSIKANADAAIDSLNSMASSLGLLSPHISKGQANINDVDNQLKDVVKAIEDMKDFNEDLIDTSDDLQGTIDAMKEIMNALAGATAGAVTQGAISSLAPQLQKLLAAYIQILTQYQAGETVNQLSGELNAMLGSANSILKKLNGIIDLGVTLDDRWRNEYRLDILKLLDDTQKVLNSTNRMLGSTAATLRSLREMLDATESSLDTAIDSTLNGLIGVLDGSIHAVDHTEVLRNAKDTMKYAIDGEIDKLEEDTNILNMDNQLEFPSFTSEKNHTPGSIQIILRTAEISIEDSTDPAADIEPVKENIGFFGRIKNIFTSIFSF